ncbi:putative reverse transcriptase domain-containing protein [Tanacetum coccineum]
MCCDDAYHVTSRVSALAGCDRLVSESLVIENFISTYGLLDIRRFRRGASRGTKGGRVVEESEKEANSDLLSDARSGPGPAESSDSCKSKVKPNNGIHVDPSNIEAVKNWKTPKTSLEIRSFLGLGVELGGAFRTLKDNLCNAPILSLPKGVEDFVVYYDSSNQGLGCVLMQRGKHSGKLLAAQNEATKEENAQAEMPRGVDQRMEKKEDGGLYFMDIICVPLIGDIGRGTPSPCFVIVESEGEFFKGSNKGAGVTPKVPDKPSDYSSSLRSDSVFRVEDILSDEAEPGNEELGANQGDNEPASDAQADFTSQFLNDNPHINVNDVLKDSVEPEIQLMVDILVTQEKPAEPRPPLVDTTSGELECRVTKLEKKVHAMSSFNLPGAIDKYVKVHLKNVLPKDVPYCGNIKLEKAKSMPNNLSTPVDQAALNEFKEKD